jgi:uncharacterized protein YuzE
MLDVDEKGRVIGIEVLGVKARSAGDPVLPKTAA